LDTPLQSNDRPKTSGEKHAQRDQTAVKSGIPVFERDYEHVYRLQQTIKVYDDEEKYKI